MKIKYWALPMMAILFFLGACESEAPMNLVAPVIEDDPAELTVTIRMGTLSDTIGRNTGGDADVEGAEGTLDYSWRKNDGTIIGTTESIYYVFESVGPDTVTVFVIDSVSDKESRSAQATVILTGEAPDGYVHPATVDISGRHVGKAGDPFYFQADVDGSESDTILWYLTGDFDNPIAQGRDVELIFDNPGFPSISVHVFYQDNFVAGQTKTLTVNPADAFDDPRADVSVTPKEFQLGKSTTAHVDVHNLIGEYTLEWYEVSTGDFKGYSDHITYTPTTLGQDELECRVIVNGLMRVNGYGPVTVTPPDGPVGPRVNLISDNHRDYAPFHFTLEADTTSGDAPIVDINWYEIVDGERQALTDYWGDLYHGIKGSPDDQLFEVEVIDANGLVATDTVWERALTYYAESFGEQKALKVGPSQAVDSNGLSHVPYQTQRYYISFLMKFDVANADRADVVVEFKYADGSSWYWTIPDLNPERPSELIVHAGEALVEAGMEIKLHYLGGIYPDKCDGWDRMLYLYGDIESNKSASSEGILLVNGSSQRPIALLN